MMIEPWSSIGHSYVAVSSDFTLTTFDITVNELLRKRRKIKINKICKEKIKTRHFSFNFAFQSESSHHPTRQESTKYK